jgi:hypothetical protein
MLTVTISDARSAGLDATSEEARSFLQERCSVFNQHIRRVFGSFGFLWVVETGEKGGRVHRHYMIRWDDRRLLSGFRRGWLPKHVLARLQAFAKSAELGRIDWMPCHDEIGAARYVTKYVTKTLKTAKPLIDGVRSRFRRYASNVHYDQPRAEGWKSVGLSLETIARIFAAAPPVDGASIWILPDWALPTRAGP